MSSSAIKYPKRLFSQTGGDASLPARVITLENNEYKITYFAEISSSTGTITVPTGATILLDQFQGGIDAYVCTIQNGQPTGNFPQTSLGVTVDVTSFNALGNYTLSGTPSSYPVALIYILKIKAKDYSNLDITKILDLEDVNAVPYIGATNNVDLGEYELKAGQVTLDITPTGTAAVGTTRWNDTIGSTETTLKGGNVVLKNGIDLVARVVNKVTPNTTLTKADYQAVRISGAQGQRLAVALAQANNDNNSADTIGLVIETITTNQEGFIMTVGQLEGINTTGSLQGETWNDGDVIYLSPTVAGRLTNVKPNAPQHIVIIGYVEYAHANNGKLYVKVMNGWELEELHNVSSTNYTTPIDTDSVLTYDVTNDIWKRLTLANLRADVLDGFNAVTVIYRDFTTGAALTGTTSITLINSALIPANTVAVNDEVQIYAKAQRDTATGNSTAYLYYNTSASLSGATLIGTSSTSASGFIPIQRHLFVKAPNDTETMLVSATQTTDLGQNAANAMSNLNINWTNNVYIIQAHANAAVGNSTTSRGIIIKRSRL